MIKELFDGKDMHGYQTQELSEILGTKLLDVWPVKEWPYEGGPYAALVAFKLFLDVTMKIGWCEHTNDWNPQLIFELVDGSQIVSLYPDFEIPGHGESTIYDDDNGSVIKVEIEGENPDESCLSKAQIEIPISQIVTVDFAC